MNQQLMDHILAETNKGAKICKKKVLGKLIIVCWTQAFEK